MSYIVELIPKNPPEEEAENVLEKEQSLIEDGWKVTERITRDIASQIKRKYHKYLYNSYNRKLTPNENIGLVRNVEKKEIDDIINEFKVYIKYIPAESRVSKRAASAAAMNNSVNANQVEESFIKKSKRQPGSVSAAYAPSIPASSKKRVEKLFNEMRAPARTSFPNASLNLPNNSRDYEGNAIPLNNILLNFNKLNIRNRNTLKRKRGNSLSLSNRRKSRKRSKSMNALRAARRTRFIRRDRRRGSKFSNLPSATRKKYIKRRFSRK
jgi:hypothetical protein